MPARRSVGRSARLAAVLTVFACSPPGAAFADQQRDPQLKAVVARAIAQAECFTDQYDSAVWYTLMEPRLRSVIADKDERLDILKQVYCETHRRGEARLPPGLVMSVIDVESRFNRWAVSSRTLATSRASVVTPGSSTSRSRSHRTASWKTAFGPSPLVHDRAATHSRSCSSASVKSFSPRAR